MTELKRILNLVIIFCCEFVGCTIRLFAQRVLIENFAFEWDVHIVVSNQWKSKLSLQCKCISQFQGHYYAGKGMIEAFAISKICNMRLNAIEPQNKIYSQFFSPSILTLCVHANVTARFLFAIKHINGVTRQSDRHKVKANDKGCFLSQENRIWKS